MLILFLGIPPQLYTLLSPSLVTDLMDFGGITNSCRFGQDLTHLCCDSALVIGVGTQSLQHPASTGYQNKQCGFQEGLG